MMFYSDDPIRDFARHDREQAKWLEKLPKCDICGEPIQDNHYYLIGSDKVCKDCLETEFRKDNDDFYV